MAMRARLLYLAGASRSGSTLIAERIAQAAHCPHVGEFRRIRAFVNEVEGRVINTSVNGDCACGASVAHCTFWSRVEERSGLDFAQATFDATPGALSRALFRTSALLFGACVTRFLARGVPAFAAQIDAARNCWKVYDAIAADTSAEIVLDSSKQIHQFLMLYVTRPNDIALIALTRNARAVIVSALKRPQTLVRRAGRRARSASSERAMLRVAAASWQRVTIQELLAWIRMTGRRRMLLRYEDFCRDPGGSINDILSRFMLLARSDDTIPISHAIGGSPSRHTQGYGEVALDETWRGTWGSPREKALLPQTRALNALLGYGYRVRLCSDGERDSDQPQKRNML